MPGRMVGPSDHALRRKLVHRRRVGGLQRGQAAQRDLRFVGTAVGYDDRVFHGVFEVLAIPWDCGKAGPVANATV